MANVRQPAVAGIFYPADRTSLEETIKSCLPQAKPSARVPKAIIVPHAGYLYSGPIAGTAYARVAQARETIRRVVLLGPSHFVPFSGIALSTADQFKTPLGLIPVDREAVEKINHLSGVAYLDRAHGEEHSLEVELPFLQTVIQHFTLVPLAVGEAKPEAVSEVLDLLWNGEEMLIVVSSDLSHYLDDKSARKMDVQTAQAIEALEAERIENAQACGAYPVRGLLVAAREHGLRAETLDLRTSGDTQGKKDRVVGYGAFAFY